MTIDKYMDIDKLADYIKKGYVDVKEHPTLDLVLYCHTRKAVYENLWDEITTKCRGLILNSNTLEIVARPFEKFFNFNTTGMPETMLQNLPTSQPVVAEKLDGSLGTLYPCGPANNLDGTPGTLYAIATKGSFSSDQAKWATAFYREFHNAAKWPEGYTPVFEIIAESIQHHVVHYHGRERLELIALINNETGVEMEPSLMGAWARSNGIHSAATHFKTVEQVVQEDRPNSEGYVLSWPRTGKPPLKIKFKHLGFLRLQKLVHAATPKAILYALTNGDSERILSWEGAEPVFGAWVHGWMARFNQAYGEILFRSSEVYKHALTVCSTRKDFAGYVQVNEPKYKAVVFAMLDESRYQEIIWKLVTKQFEEELSKPFALVEDLD